MTGGEESKEARQNGLQEGGVRQGRKEGLRQPMKRAGDQLSARGRPGAGTLWGSHAWQGTSHDANWRPVVATPAAVC